MIKFSKFTPEGENADLFRILGWVKKENGIGEWLKSLLHFQIYKL